jgi:hypothetical protein
MWWLLSLATAAVQQQQVQGAAQQTQLPASSIAAQPTM